MQKKSFLLISFLIIFINIYSQNKESDSLYNIGLQCYNRGDYRQAALYFSRSYSNDRKIMDTLSFRRYNSNMWMNHCLSFENERNINLPYYSKCQPINRADTYGVDSILTNAKVLSEKWKFDDALDEYKRAVVEIRNKWGSDNQLYSYCLMNYYECIATISFLRDDNISTKYELTKIGNIILDLYERNYFYIDEKFYSIILDLSLNYQRLGHYRNSIDLIIKGLNQFLARKNIDSEEWKVKLLKEASDAYFLYLCHYGFDSEIAQYAINVGRDIEDYYKKNSIYSQSENLDYINTKSINVDDYAKNMYYLSYYGFYLHEYDYAEKKAIEGIRELSRFPKGNENKWYAPLFNNYATVCWKKNDIETALKLELQILNYYYLRNKYKQHDSEIEVTLKNIINLFEKKGEIDSLVSYARQYYTHFSEKAHSMYFEYPNDRISYWNCEIHYIEALCRYASMHGETELPSILYNTLLISKGYLLEGEDIIERIAKSCGDNEIVNKYKMLLSAKKNSKNSTPKIMQLEEEIRSNCRKYYNIAPPTFYDIRNKLDGQSAVVEFFHYKDNDTVYYNALLMKNDLETPLLIHCFSYSEMDKITLENNLIYSKRIWENVLEHCAEITNIFFIPTGILQTFPIENLPLWDKEGLLCEIYNLHRLSSSREITKLNMFFPQGSKYALLGGLYFDEYSEQDEFTNNANQKRGAEGIQFLPKSKDEVKSIYKLIKNKKGDVDIFTGYNGTKETVKKLANGQYKVIHFATHGFYNMEKAESVIAFGSPIEFGPNRDKLDENLALSYTGLYLSISNKYESQDSILFTAKDISQLNFSGVDMVVLSACETAQGINSIDGVYGLQRGFKKAGVNSILMSLWKVDDDATCLLMTEFYKNWMGKKGTTKYEALKLAKQAVRAHKEKGWDDPKYWAAFVLLDGLD